MTAGHYSFPAAGYDRWKTTEPDWMEENDEPTPEQEAEEALNEWLGDWFDDFADGGYVNSLVHDASKGDTPVRHEDVALKRAEAEIERLRTALSKIEKMLGTAFGAGVYDLGPPAHGTEGTRLHSQNGYAQAIYDVAQAALVIGGSQYNATPRA